MSPHLIENLLLHSQKWKDGHVRKTFEKNPSISSICKSICKSGGGHPLYSFLDLSAGELWVVLHALAMHSWMMNLTQMKRCWGWSWAIHRNRTTRGEQNPFLNLVNKVRGMSLSRGGRTFKTVDISMIVDILSTTITIGNDIDHEVNFAKSSTRNVKHLPTECVKIL